MGTRSALLISASLFAVVACGDAFEAGDGGAGGEGDGGSGGTTSTGGAGSGGIPNDPIGCSDGTREYLTNPNQHPRIAGCQGAWDQPGTAAAPACASMSGNDYGDNPLGAGCSAADLCSKGWHVCETATEVGALVGATCPDSFKSGELWIVAQTVDASARCSGPGAGNNVLGCGEFGSMDAPGSCAPLTKMMLFPDCDGGAVWRCGNDPNLEGATITKVDPSAGGGVLCCAD